MTFEDRLNLLQQSLEENTNAVLQLSMILSAGGLPLVAQGEVACNTPSLSPVTAPCTPPPPDDEAVQETASDDSSSPSDAEDVTQDNAISYDDFKASMTALITDKGREKALATLGAFGIKKLPEAHPDTYRDIIAAMEAA